MIRAQEPAVLDASPRARYGAAAPRPGKVRGASVEDEPRGKVDLVAILYIVGGIPALVGFLVLLFWLTRACNAPA